MKNKQKMCEMCEGKGFNNWSANRFHFTFPNGNHISVVWGSGTYSDNHDARDYLNDRTKFRTSNTVEVMFDCGKVKQNKVYKHFKTEGQPLGHLTMKQFIWLFNELSK